MASIALKIGCSTETLRKWVQRSDVTSGARAVATDEQKRMRELEREVRELKSANEILKKAAAYFAVAELDPRP